MSTLKACEELFGTKDVYKLFELNKTAQDAAIKKAYYKLSMKVHPDRVDAAEKEAATEKFKVLSKIYQVLIDKDKRALYDEQGIIDDDDMNVEEGKLNNWLDLWRKLFKPLTDDEIQQYESTYIGSELERKDIMKAYLSGKGCINHMMNEVPFLKVEDEPRLQQIVREMIDSGEVPEYELFTKEPAQKRNRRHKKYERESKEAQQIKQKLLARKQTNGGDQDSLTKQLMLNQKAREAECDSFFDRLLQKYGGIDEDSSDAIDFDSLDKNENKNKKFKKAAGGSSDTAKKRDSLRSVKRGGVKK